MMRTSLLLDNPTATAESNAQVTVNNELPGNQNRDNATPARDQSKKTEETNNYEISRTTKTEVTEAGRVNRISVAVLVDGSYAKNDKGEMVYQERSKEQLDRIAALVRSAIGFDQKRGDQVEVVNLRFAEQPTVPPVVEPTGWLSMFQFTKDDVMYVIELGVMMLLGLVVLFMVIRPLVKRAAILMLALGDQYGGKVWQQLDDDEVRELSLAMSTLGNVEAETVEDMLLEFVSRMSASGALMGNFDATERLLQQYLPPERVNGIMDEIRGPAGRNMWEKLSNVQEEVLANYLKNEYPQTIAVVLSKLKPEHAARVLGIFPEDLALDVVNRMLKMEAVQKEVIESVEKTLRTEFMSNLSQTRRRDAHEVMAEIFNNFDRQTETRFITSLEEDNRESAERIKALMFTFDDLVKLDAASAQTLMRNIDKDKLGIALKSANEEVRSFFLGNMSSRAGKMLMDDMAAMGPVRLRDVDEAQALLVNLAKDMAAKGEITLTKNRADDELVY